MSNSITGMQVYYYFVCHRKLWYFSNEIRFESENEDVRLGKIIDETTYKNKTKHIMIDNIINIDYVEEHNILHEVKKSKNIEQASIWQLKYYIYYLKSKGVSGLKGKIDYPLLKQSVGVELTEEDEVTLKGVLKDITDINSLDRAPQCEPKKFCKSCAYYSFCYI